MKKILSIISLLLLTLSFKTSVFAYTTNMNASVVVGQPNFTSNSSAISQTNVYPSGIFTDGTKLYAVDVFDRVLIWNHIPTSNNQPADIVLGETDFTTDNGCAVVNASTICTFNDLTVANGKLIIPDYGNHRILIWNTVPTSTYAASDVVIGQVDFTHHSVNQGGTVNSNTLQFPTSAAVYGDKLIVADADNDRVLIFNHIPTSNNASADVVIGQADFTHNSANRGGSVASNTLFEPYGVTVVNGKLLIADQFNHRVLVYNSIPTSNGASADVVIGQADFTHNSANQGGTVAANTLDRPTGFAFDGKRLFIADQYNSRVLVFDGVPTANNTSAIQVIGQSSFSGGSANQGGTTNSNTLNFPSFNFAAYKDKLFIPDVGNHRILIYNNITSPLNSQFTLKLADTSSTISYFTSTATSEYLEYGTDNGYGSIIPLANNNPRINSHSILLSNLQPCTTYHYKVTATDGSLQDSVSGDNTFNTTGTCSGFSSTWHDSTGGNVVFGPAMANNIYTSDVLPSFSFTQANDSQNGISKYQIIVSSPQYGDVVYLDNIMPTSGNGTDTFEDDTRYEKYNDQNHTITVKAKQDTQKMASGAYKWKIRAINTKNAIIDSEIRTLRIQTNNAIFSDQSLVFPLSLLQVGEKTKLVITSDYPQKTPLTIVSHTPTFYGISNVGAHVSLTLVKHHDQENYDETFSFNTDTNSQSRWGINVSPALSNGTYQVYLSATNDAGDYVELPPFTLKIGVK